MLTTAIVAGTLGSTITAELGARKIRQELEALEVIGINPVRNLVLPRVVALGLMMPVLNLLTFWAGVLRDVRRRDRALRLDARAPSSTTCCC